MQVVLYSDDRKSEWNECIRKSRCGTFLLERDYMDYHSERFNDCSLMFYSEKGKLLAVLPANIKGTRVESHGGLTYGGIVGGLSMTQTKTLEALELAIDYFRNNCHATELYYKPIPYIYNRYLSDEDLYALFQMGAKLVNRGVSQTIDLLHRPQMTTLRQRQLKKAYRMGLYFCQGQTTDDWREFWAVLVEVLKARHGISPVHSIDEMLLLNSRYSENIKLFLVRQPNENKDNDLGTIIAGTVLYLTDNVVHAQYIAANDDGRANGALSFLFHSLIDSQICCSRQYFDFGISTEENGRILNEGLTFQKEGFGGRAVCYDGYLLSL